MIEKENKLSVNEVMIKMIDSINNNRRDLFYGASEEYVNSLPQSNKHQYRMKRLLQERPREMRILSLDKMSHDTRKLITQTDIKNDNVFLNDGIKTLIDELLLEWKNSDVFKLHNINVRNKILLYGTTGNGKTTIAKYIAQLSDLPFVQINSDNLIESSLGSTGKNINKIFNDIQGPCILFFDEIDTIGKTRGKSDSNSAGVENDRMVNSFLINMEKMHPETIFIGATNRFDALDPAFTRRFDIKFELAPPTEMEKENFSIQMAQYYNIPFEPHCQIFKEKQNYYEIKNYFVDLTRKYVFDKITNNK